MFLFVSIFKPALDYPETSLAYASSPTIILESRSNKILSFYTQANFYKASSEKFLIFADGDMGEIYKVPLAVPGTPCSPLEIKRNISRPVAVDYDPVEGKIYWTDVTFELVGRAFPNGSSVDVIAHNGVHTPAGMAVDYVGRAIYWTDEGNNKIEMARLDGSFRRSLITSNIEKPRAIILDIAKR